MNIKNFASATVDSPPTGTGGTSMVLATGHGARMPAIPFMLTLWDLGTSSDPTVAYHASKAEIVRVTAVSTDTLTIVRAQEGTTARDFTGLTCGVLSGPTIRVIEHLGNQARAFCRHQRLSHSWGHKWNDGPQQLVAAGGTIANWTDVSLDGVFGKYGYMGRQTVTAVNDKAAYTWNGWNSLDGVNGSYLLSNYSYIECGWTLRTHATLPDATDDFTCWTYFGEGPFAASANSNLVGAKLSKDGIQFGALAANVFTQAGSTQSIAGATDYHLAVRYWPGSRLECYLNGTLVGTITTGLPATTKYAHWAVQTMKIAGSVARTIYVGPGAYELEL